MLKTKILVVGPSESGKTTFANYLSEHTENIGGDYRPTVGVRVLEFEVGGIKVKGRNSTVDVELWDCSGDHKYESCWPAMAKDTNGIIFLYNPDQPNQDKELESWHSYFTETVRLRDTQCLVVARTSSESSDLSDSLPPVFAKMTNIKSNLEEDPESVRNEFNKFVMVIANAMSEKNEQEELNIMKQS